MQLKILIKAQKSSLQELVLNNPGDSTMQPGYASDAAKETKALSIIYWMTDTELSDGVRTDFKEPGSPVLT